MFSGLTRSLQNEWAYIKNIIDHPEEKFTTLDCALAKSSKKVIFGVNQVKYYLLQIALLPVSMAGLCFLQTIH